MKNPARFPAGLGYTFQGCSFVLELRYNPYSPEVVNFLAFSTKDASPLADLNTAWLLCKRVSLLRSKILPLAPKVTPFPRLRKLTVFFGAAGPTFWTPSFSVCGVIGTSSLWRLLGIRESIHRLRQ